MFELINLISVSLYGICISFFMLDIVFTMKTKMLFCLFASFVNILLILTTSFYGLETAIKIYPLLVHLPFLLFVRFQFKLPINEIILALLTAYIFTTPRKWFGDLVSHLMGGSANVTFLTQIFLSIPLLLLFYTFLRKPFIKITHASSRETNIFLALAGTYYTVAYATTVYSNLLYEGRVVAVGFLASCVTLLLFLLILYYFKEITNRVNHENKELMFNMQIDATKEHIENLKESQLKASIIRHDMHHHLQQMNAYIENGNIIEALDYIRQTSQDIESTTVKKYCENDTVNLVLASFVTKTKKLGIEIIVDAIIPSLVDIATTDLCVILANGMDNAIHACQRVPEDKERKINFFCHLKNHKIFIQIINTYEGDIEFQNDIPVTHVKGHGMGVTSITIIAKKYHGIYSFTAENGTFTLSVIL